MFQWLNDLWAKLTGGGGGTDGANPISRTGKQDDGAPARPDLDTPVADQWEPESDPPPGLGR